MIYREQRVQWNSWLMIQNGLYWSIILLRGYMVSLLVANSVCLLSFAISFDCTVDLFPLYPWAFQVASRKVLDIVWWNVSFDHCDTLAVYSNESLWCDVRFGRPWWLVPFWMDGSNSSQGLFMFDRMRNAQNVSPEGIDVSRDICVVIWHFHTLDSKHGKGYLKRR